MEIELKRIILFTDQFKIEGQIRVPVAGYRGRVSDFLNQDQVKFIPVLNPTISKIDGEVLLTPLPESILVNKDRVALAYEPSEGVR